MRYIYESEKKPGRDAFLFFYLPFLISILIFYNKKTRSCWYNKKTTICARGTGKWILFFGDVQKGKIIYKAGAIISRFPYIWYFVYFA